MKKYDAILFAVPSFRHDKQAELVIPQTRSMHQRYIMVIREAPWPDLQPPWINRKYFANDFFNWTWTYRDRHTNSKKM